MMNIPVQSKHSGLYDSVLIFLSFFKRYPFRTLIVICALAFSGVAEGMSITLFLPLIQRVIDPTMTMGGRMGSWIFKIFEGLGLNVSLSGILLFIVCGLAVKSGLFWLAMNQVGFTIARVAMDLRLDLIKAILRARWGYFVSHRAGRFATAIATEAMQASAAYQNAAAIWACLFQVTVYIVLAIIWSWKVAAAGTAAGLFFIFIMRPLIGLARETSKRQVRHMKSVTGRVVDILHGLKPVKAMAREKALLRYLAVEAEELNSAQRTQVRANTTVTAAQEPILALAMAIGLYSIVMSKLMPFSELLVQAFLFSRLFNQINQFVLSYQRLVIAESSYVSIRALTADILTSQESPDGKPAPSPLRKGVLLRNVRFAYNENYILDDVSIDIPAHQWTSLIGPSGSGKTTLSDLVAGLYTPESGTILIEDLPINEVNITDWRHRIGYVPQEMLLLHDTILANITLGETDIKAQDVEEALCKAGAWSFVKQLPDGVNTIVGERGARLSGGQRQRIALARALVRKPELLILDEASASLDPMTEAALCSTLCDLRKQTTILAISHQPAFALAADRVYRVEAGKVILER
jgi:ATP-binding cassette, subfamily C, bacterial